MSDTDSILRARDVLAEVDAIDGGHVPHTGVPLLNGGFHGRDSLDAIHLSAGHDIDAHCQREPARSSVWMPQIDCWESLAARDSRTSRSPGRSSSDRGVELERLKLAAV